MEIVIGNQYKPLVQNHGDKYLSDKLNISKVHSILKILQFVQDDYCQAKRQLENIYLTFRDRELQTTEQLQALLDSGVFTAWSKNVTTNEEIQNQKIEVNSTRTTIRAYCFGSFELYINSEQIANWHSQKAKTLFKYLIKAKKKPITREALVETLWPDCDPEIGRNNLKSAIYSLRQTLSTNSHKDMHQIVLFKEGQYLINPEVDIWVDVDEFEHNWLVGRTYEKILNKEEADRKYHLAEELYRGDYFEDDPYLEWTMLPREALKDTYLAILGKLAQSSFEEADYESCIIYSQKILANDVCHEEAYRWLIKCYVCLGQCHRAHQWYDICANTLKRELDTKPDQKTTILYQQLQKQIVSLP